MACKRRSSVHHRSDKTVAFCRFVNIQSPNSPFEVPCTLYFSVVNRLYLKKWRTRGVLWSTTEVAKLLLCVGSSRFSVQILQSKLLHAHFILVSSIGSAESNGVQNAFLGKPKIKVSFHKLSQKRLRLTIQCYMLSTKLRFWTTVVFGLAQFFSQQLLCELPISQYCVVGVRYIYVSDTSQEPKSDIKSLYYQSWCIVIEMLKTHNTMYCVKCVSYCKIISYMHVAQVPV